MKKYILMFGLTLVMGLFISNTVVAQWISSPPNLYTTTDNVGIGTTSPTSLLDVAKAVTEPTITVRNLGSNGGASFRMYDQNSGADYKFKSTFFGDFKIRDQVYAMDPVVIEKNSANNALYIKSGGNIGIGTTNPQSLLSVNGKISAKEVEVTLSGWSDFVFYDDYYLRPLCEVEQFIQTNRHLPDVPSEAEVLANGVNVGEMSATLLLKIEELTLYIIDLNKRIAELEK